VDPLAGLDGSAQCIDLDALALHTDLGAMIARSSGGVASGALDAARSQAVGLDEWIARWVARLLRRGHRAQRPHGPGWPRKIPGDAGRGGVSPTLGDACR
jgi:hypothetical protein